VGALALVAATGCSPVPATETGPPSTSVEEEDHAGALRDFGFTTLDGRTVSSEGYRGRMTVVAFITTYDLGSYVQARYVNTVFKRHKPRTNALVLVLEPPENLDLVQAFMDNYAIDCDVAMADAETIAGRGPFPGVGSVPSLVLLDRRGREVWRNLGIVTTDRLDAAITEHE
jgi:hypothetical protein